VMRMSRPIVRRRLSGTHPRSNRVRTLAQAQQLRESGDRRRVLSLSGVLFFGNAEELAREVMATFQDADVVVLDCRGATDIDASGANIIRELAEKTRKLGKLLLFCNVPNSHMKAIERAAGGGQTPSLFIDLDSALEWAEKRELDALDQADMKSGLASVEDHDLTRGLSAEERGIFDALLTRRLFAKGETLGLEGESGDRMWLIMNGSVDIRLRVDDARGSRRIASLGTGTTVGEMALIEKTTRSASIVAGEDVETLELNRAAYETIVRDHPHIGEKLLINLFGEMARRLRNTSEQLRETES
jgi:sulfate permease, SulP family